MDHKWNIEVSRGEQVGLIIDGEKASSASGIIPCTAKDIKLILPRNK